MFYINEKVKITNLNIIGKIADIQKTKNTYKYNIDIGDKIIQTIEDNIEIIDEEKIGNVNYIKSKRGSKINVCLNNSQDFKPEIMLRHQNVDIAIFNLDSFINEAICRGVKTVKIIHGKHGGIIRKAVHDYLKSNKNIVEFHLGNYFEGQYGVTIATLK